MFNNQFTLSITSFDLTFSENVQLLSYEIGAISNLEGDESFTLNDGTSSSTENSPFSVGSRNFNNPFSVSANTSIGYSNTNVESSDLFHIKSITVQPMNTNVPTLSEWGLIILALLLMTLGTLYLVQQPRFEQEG